VHVEVLQVQHTRNSIDLRLSTLSLFSLSVVHYLGYIYIYTLLIFGINIRHIPFFFFSILVFPKFLKRQLPLSPGISVLTHTRRKNKELWEERISYFALIRHGPHRKRRVQQFLCSCMCIRCSGNFLTEPLLSNDKWVHIQTHSPSRDRYLHITTQTQNKRRQTSMPWVGFEPTIPVFEGTNNSSCHRPRGHCDRHSSCYCNKLLPCLSITWDCISAYSAFS
jgi:hypothetical protein